MAFYAELFKELETAEIKYLVVGGVAVVLHGFVRATADLDLVVALDPENLKKFFSLMKSRGYRPKVPVVMEDFANPQIRKSWIRDKEMKVFSLFHPQRPMELIDIFVEEPIPFDEAYGRKQAIKLGLSSVSLMSVPDLITLKKKAGRPQDLHDIEGLKEILKKGRE